MSEPAEAAHADPAALQPFIPPSPPRTPKSAGTRKLLLRLAAGLFVRDGYSAVSMQDIATAANLTKGALYGHFRSKGQLLVEVIRTQLAEADAAVDYAEVLDRPRGIELMYGALGRESRLLQVDAAAAARHDADVAAGLRELYLDRYGRIQAAMAPADDPAAGAQILAALTHGIGVQEAASIPMVDGDRLNAAIQGVLRGLGA